MNRTETGDPATVSSFRLDKYEVTVGLFRQFVSALKGGYKPAAGSGKHALLNDGQGLANSASPGTYERGWVTSDNADLAMTSAGLSYCGQDTTWTDPASAQENLPINCVDWYQA
jgi:sulfatase modifying factor 1